MSDVPFTAASSYWLARHRPASGPDVRGFARFVRRAELGTHSAAICGQVLMCAVPVLVLLAALAQRLTGVSVVDVTDHVLALTPAAHRVVADLLAGPARASTGALWLNLVLAVVLGTGLAASLQHALERVFGLTAPGSVSALARQVAWSLTLPLFASGLVLSGRGGAGLPGQFAMVVAFAWWTPRLLTAHRVPDRVLWRGTAATVLALGAALLVARWWFSGQVVGAARVYGTAGTVMLVASWLVAVSTVVSAAAVLGYWMSIRHDRVRRA